MKKRVKIAIVIGAVIVVCILIKFLVFPNNNNVPPPQPQPQPQPQPTGGGGYNGYFQVTYPLNVSKNLYLVNNQPIGLTDNYTNNYTLIKDDIGSSIGQPTFPVLKCQVDGKYVSIVFVIDSVNYLDLSNHTINMTDTFYVNAKPDDNKNQLIGSLFLDSNMILSVVLSFNPQILVANYIKGKIIFDISGNSTATNIYINNDNLPSPPKSQNKPYFLHLPKPISLQINSPSEFHTKGFILQENQDISVCPYDPTKKLYLTQSLINNKKVLYLSTDNTYSKFLKKTDCVSGNYTPGDKNVLNFPNNLSLDSSILNTTCPATLFLTPNENNNTINIGITHGGNFNLLCQITPFPSPSLPLGKNQPAIICASQESGFIGLFLALQQSNSLFHFTWDVDATPHMQLYPDNLGNYFLGRNVPVFLLGSINSTNYLQFNYKGKNSSLGNEIDYFLTESSDINVNQSSGINAVGTVMIDPNSNKIIIMFSDTVVTGINNEYSTNGPYFLDTADINSNIFYTNSIINCTYA